MKIRMMLAVAVLFGAIQMVQAQDGDGEGGGGGGPTEDEQIESALEAGDYAALQAELASEKMRDVVAALESEHDRALQHGVDYSDGVEILLLPEDETLLWNILMALDQSSYAIDSSSWHFEDMEFAAEDSEWGSDEFILENWDDASMWWETSEMDALMGWDDADYHDFDMQELQSQNDSVEAELAAWGF